MFSFAFYATLRSIIIFLIVSLPFTYKTTNRVLGGIVGRIADQSGCPTLRGLILHSIVFGLIIYTLMGIHY
jgi:hypothetical protein